MAYGVHRKLWYLRVSQGLLISAWPVTACCAGRPKWTVASLNLGTGMVASLLMLKIGNTTLMDPKKSGIAQGFRPWLSLWIVSRVLLQKSLVDH